jgi:response regulator RpfG family c-di-GMP phosphodiesterase
MAKRVLDVGNCAADRMAIRDWIRKDFDVQIVAAARWDDALRVLRRETFDLVLVNRRLAADAADGVGLIARIKSDPDLARTPVMLVSDYPEHQARAVAAGAEPGFGKAQIDSSTAREKLGRFLG